MKGFFLCDCLHLGKPMDTPAPKSSSSHLARNKKAVAQLLHAKATAKRIQTIQTNLQSVYAPECGDFVVSIPHELMGYIACTSPSNEYGDKESSKPYTTSKLIQLPI